jgi:two-component system response regulator AtoC
VGVILPKYMKNRQSPVKCLGDFHGLSLKQAQEIMEEELIVKGLDETNGNRVQASKLLEISYPSLLSKIKKYGVDPG